MDKPVLSRAALIGLVDDALRGLGPEWWYQQEADAYFLFGRTGEENRARGSWGTYYAVRVAADAGLIILEHDGGFSGVDPWGSHLARGQPAHLVYVDHLLFRSIPGDSDFQRMKMQAPPDLGVAATMLTRFFASATRFRPNIDSPT